MILEAEGRREAAFRDAEARERFAQAEARAIGMIATSIENGNMQAVNYLIAIKYMGSVNNVATSDNTKLMLMPLETSGIIGALSSVKEIFKEASFPARK